jgi:hypothetical protein
MKLVVISDTGESVEARCDGCRHWKAKSEWGWPDQSSWRFGGYAEAQHCKQIGEKVAEAYSAHAMGGGGGDMFTMPDFACTLFERKETA